MINVDIIMARKDLNRAPTVGVERDWVIFRRAKSDMKRDGIFSQ